MRSRLALGALALIVGFSIAAVPRLLDDDSEQRITNAARGNPRAIPTAPSKPQLTPATEGAATSAPSGPEAPAAALPSAAAAVEAFLRAEAQGDFGTSYGLLAGNDRIAHQSRAGWSTEHAQLPVIRDFTLEAVRLADGRAEVDAKMRLAPELDLVVGLVPSSARATWVAVAEDGGWRVDFGASSLVPEYLPVEGAEAAARTWIERRAGCGVAARNALLGTRSLGDALCAARGPVRLAAAGALAPSESSDPFLAAYGPDVFTWARVVPVTSPARVGAVLAPLGPRWRVIGLVDLPFLPTNPQEGAKP